MYKLFFIKCHKKNYTLHINCNINEVVANFDKKEFLIDSRYSLHTEYSHMKRKFNSPYLEGLEHIKSANKDSIPQLWKNIEWAINFANFIKKVISNNLLSEFIEIYPPFDDYCSSLEQFIDIYKYFQDELCKTSPGTKILIKNRCGTQYRGGKFLISTGNDILKLCSIIKKKNIELKVLLDYPELFSAEKIKMGNIKLDQILDFNSKLVEFRRLIRGFYMWGKSKGASEKKLLPKIGDFNTFFSNDEMLKTTFLTSIYTTFNDDTNRYFVPKVNSSENDLNSIVIDMERFEFSFSEVESKPLQFIRVKWKNETPFLELYDFKNDKLIKINALGKINIRKLESKLCVGSYDLTTHNILPCKSNIPINSKQKTCSVCQNFNGFKYCIMCRGDKCYTKNSEALEYCNQQHFVYLAYFPEKVIKVGTSNLNRKYERLIEQGALYGLIIASAPTGKIARKIENSISKIGYKSSVTSKYKISHLTYNLGYEDIIGELTSAYKSIKEQLSYDFEEFFIEPSEFLKNTNIAKKLKEALSQTSNEQLSLWNNLENTKYEIIDGSTQIIGEVLVVVGTVAIIKSKSEGDKTYAFDFKNLYGWQVKLNDKL